jgi:hypothetical protein
MKYVAIIIMLFFSACSRPPIEKATTTIFAQSPPDKQGNTILYMCDIDIVVNNTDGSVGVKYYNFSPWFAYQHPSTLQKRAEEVVEQLFPHLGDVVLQNS